ncbi:hypothetical protein AJ78_06950 [Emergomyces pasteurianus Ep9510]|uniref:Uncharacterized protein n=1 Tax=Emergomyces pasteurianus Ep9510 TaxID=1447872 RepID=A0A1J9P752_9EURO|nr:hypothetical protein AJ78_06950 [Emergomyces pasteurianus Ep9510]
MPRRVQRTVSARPSRSTPLARFIKRVLWKKPRPSTKSFTAADIWEKVHIGDYWMDGVPTLHPDEHPLWKGYIEAGDITQGHDPLHYLQLTSEQFEALRQLLEDSTTKVCPFEALWRWWPRHFNLNEKFKRIQHSTNHSRNVLDPS